LLHHARRFPGAVAAPLCPSVTWTECLIVAGQELAIQAVATWIGNVSASSRSRLLRKFWKTFGHGVRPAGK
jgi:hypothetical protein